MIKLKILAFVFFMCGVVAVNHFFAEQSFIDGFYEEAATYDGIETPPTKIPSIGMNVGPLLQALLERVWVTKYYGAPAEIFKFSSDMPLCDALPDVSTDQGDTSGVFLWKEKCLPIELRYEKKAEDGSGMSTVRMLDFDGASEVLEEAFEIIRADALGMYKIKEDQKEAITKMIKDLESNDPQFPQHYKKRFKTYSKLEGRFYLDETPVGDPETTSDFDARHEETRRYFAARGKVNALTIGYNPNKFVKKENIVEYSLILPKGFSRADDTRPRKRMKPSWE